MPGNSEAQDKSSNMNTSSSQLSWEETKSIVSEVEELFKLEQDLPVVREVSMTYICSIYLSIYLFLLTLANKKTDCV